MAPARFEAAWHAWQENKAGQKPRRGDPGTGPPSRAAPGWGRRRPEGYGPAPRTSTALRVPAGPACGRLL